MQERFRGIIGTTLPTKTMNLQYLCSVVGNDRSQIGNRVADMKKKE